MRPKTVSLQYGIVPPCFHSRRKIRSKKRQLTTGKARAAPFRHHILRGRPPHEQGRIRLVQRRGAARCESVLSVGVTVGAGVAAGTVGTDVNAGHAAAQGALAARPELKGAPRRAFHEFPAEAARRPDAESFKFAAFRTGAKTKTVGPRSRRKARPACGARRASFPARRGPQGVPGFWGTSPRKLDHARTRATPQPSGKVFKTAHMPRHGIRAAKQERIVTPNHALRAEGRRKFPKSVQPRSAIRQSRLHLLPVGRQRELKDAGPLTQIVKAGKQGQRVLGPQGQTIHIGP